MNISVKKIDLKELKEFKVIGDKHFCSKPVHKPLPEEKTETENKHLYIKKMQSLLFLAKAAIK